jgi:hypothetical protein
MMYKPTLYILSAVIASLAVSTYLLSTTPFAYALHCTGNPHDVEGGEPHGNPHDTASGVGQSDSAAKGNPHDADECH